MKSGQRARAADHRVVAEVVDEVPDPRLAIEALRFAPHRMALAEQVEYLQTPLRDRVEKRLDAILLPESALVHEGPALQQPDRVGVRRRHAVVDRAPELREVPEIPARRRHLDEGVRGIAVFRAEEPGLFLEECSGDLREPRVSRVEHRRVPLDPADLLRLRIRPFLQQRLRHVPRETLQDRRHPELALAGENLSRQRRVARNPVLRQRPAMPVEAAHPLERQVRRPGEKRIDLGVRHPEAPAYRLPHRLLPGHRQRLVDAVQRHPVDARLPLRPVPPRHRVAKRAVVEEIPRFRPGLPPHHRRHRGQRHRQAGLAAVHRHGRMRKVLEVPVQPDRHRQRRIPADHDLPGAARELEHVAAGGVRDRLEDKAIRARPEHAMRQSCRRGGRIGGAHRSSRQRAPKEDDQPLHVYIIGDARRRVFAGTALECRTSCHRFGGRS